MSNLLTKKAMALWAIALIALIAGALLLRVSESLRQQTQALARIASATEREAARVKAAEKGVVPLALHFTPRGLVATIDREIVNLERAPANEVFETLVDYERRGFGQVGQFSLAFPEPGRVSGTLSPAQKPAAQK